MESAHTQSITDTGISEQEKRLKVDAGLRIKNKKRKILKNILKKL